MEDHTGIASTHMPLALQDASICGSFPDSVWCVDRTSGTERWKREIASASYDISDLPVQDGQVFFIVDGNQTQVPDAPFPSFHQWFYAVDEKSGMDLWPRFDVGGAGTPSTPLAADGMVWAGSTTDVFTFDAPSGKKLWGGEPYSTRVVNAHGKPLWSAGVLYVANYKYLTAFNATSGAKLWAFDMGADTGFSSPALCGNAVVIINKKGEVLAVDTGSYTHRPQFPESANVVVV